MTDATHFCRSMMRLVFVGILVFLSQSALSGQARWLLATTLPTLVARGGTVPLVVSAIEIDKSNHIYMGSQGTSEGFSVGKLSRSADDGKNWTELAYPSTLGVNAIALDNAGRLLVATDDAVYRSADAGATWRALSLPTGVAPTVLKVSLSGQLFLGAYKNGMFKSSDEGETWVPINTGLTDMNITTIAVDEKLNRIYVGTKNAGVFRSTDGGNQWESINTDISSVLGSTTTLSCNNLYIDSAGYLYAGMFGGLFKSTDGGSTWTGVNTSVNWRHVHAMARTAENVLYTAVENQNGVVSIYMSVDEGRSWIAQGYQLTNVKLTTGKAMALDNKGQVFFGANDRLYRNTKDEVAGVWIATDQGLDVFSILSLGFDSAGNAYAGTHTGHVYKSTDSASTWKQLDTQLTARYPRFTLPVRALLPLDDGIVIAGLDGGGTIKTSDGGLNWSPANFQTHLSVNSLWSDGNGSVWAGTGSSSLGAGALYTSTDKGDNWTQASLTNIYGQVITADANGHLYLLSNSKTGSPSSIYKSHDQGQTWIPLPLTGLEKPLVSHMVVDPDGNVFIGTDSGVYQLLNGASSWVSRHANLPSKIVTAIGMDGNKALYVSIAFNGIYRSQDNGETWIKATDGLYFQIGGNTVHTFQRNPKGEMFAVTDAGVFRYVAVPSGGSSSGSSTPSSGSLPPTGSTNSGNNTTPSAPTLPDPPLLKTVTPGNLGLTVAFTPGADGGSPITTYTATCTDGVDRFTEKVTDTRTPITVKGLSLDKSYICNLTATNSQGTSPPSASSDSVSPRFGIAAKVEGPLTAQLITALVSASQADKGKNGNVFVGVFVQGVGSFFLTELGGWEGFDDPGVDTSTTTGLVATLEKMQPYYAKPVVLDQHTIACFDKALDLSALKGAVVFVGYSVEGSTAADSLHNGTFDIVYIVH